MINKILNSLEEYIMAISLAFMTIITFINVIARYFFGLSMIWQQQATQTAFYWLVLIGISYCVRTNNHIVVDMLISRFTHKIKIFFAQLAVVICILYCVFMFIGNYELIQTFWMMGNMARDIPIPEWLRLLIFPVGFTLIGYRFLQILIQLFKGNLQSLEPATHADPDLVK